MSETQEEEFECEFCGKTFTSKGSLQAHQLRSHRVSPKTGKAPAPTLDAGDVVLESQSGRFKKVLELCNLPQAQIAQIMVKAPNLDLNNLYVVCDLLLEFGVQRDRVSSIVNIWSTMEHIPLPADLAQRLGIRVKTTPLPSAPSAYNYPDYDPYGYLRRPQPPPQSNLVELAEAIKILKSDNSDPDKQRLIEELRLRDQAERERNLLEKLSSQFQTLHEKTIESFNKVIEKLDERLNILEEKLEKPVSSDGYKEDSFRLLAQSIDKFTGVLREKDWGDKAFQLFEKLIEPAVSQETRERDEKILQETISVIENGIVKAGEKLSEEEKKFFPVEEA